MRKPRMWLKHGLKPQKFLQDSALSGRAVYSSINLR